MNKTVKTVVLAAAVILSLAAWNGLNALLETAPEDRMQHVLGENPMPEKKIEYKGSQNLTPEQHRVMILCGTEPPFSGEYNLHFEKGSYACAACGALLFRSDSKYDHGTGWPSFTAPAARDAVIYRADSSFGMERIEVRCAACGAHLGHLFDDGPGPARTHYCINSVALRFIAGKKPGTATASHDPRSPASGERPSASSRFRTATFAAGCFWGVESRFRSLKGVRDTEVGYTGGSAANPTYPEVCAGTTGHAEAVRITYDPAVTSYEELVRFFFSIHDPAQKDRQGPDIGTQYRSEIFYHDEDQRTTALKVMSEISASLEAGKSLATVLEPAGKFTRAEEYHQRYIEKNGDVCGVR
jgi:peptide methionine sulfoxide reductase msrA/msrB